jgi:hypothetical protein
MNFLLLFIGLSFCIVGVIFKKDFNKKTQSKLFIISGVLLVFAYLIFWWIGIKTSLMIFFIVGTFIMVGVWIAIKLKDFPSISNKLTDGQNNILKWSIYLIIILSSILLGIHGAILPTVTLENGVIQMGGSFGGDFKVFDIQSVDTVSIYPKIGYMRGGSTLFGSTYGNFDMENEDKTAKMCIYRYKSPFIKVRMNDNHLFLLNFYEQDKTIAFYKQLKNALNTK